MQVKYIEDYFKDFEIIEKLLPRQKMNLQYSASGYGRKIPTSKMIKIGKKFYRLYCCIFSNVGSCYIIKNKIEYFLKYSSY